MFSQIHCLYPRRAQSQGVALLNQSTAVSSSAVPVTGFAQTAVVLVTFQVQSGAVNARWDGVAPTASVGFNLTAGSTYTWDADMYNNAQFIKSGATDAVIYAAALTC